MESDLQPGPLLMNRPLLFTALAGVLLVTGCESSSPTSLPSLQEEGVLEELALRALSEGEARGVPLPSYHGLVRLTFQAVQEDPTTHAKGLDLLKRARHQAKLAAQARKAGDETAAKEHQHRSRGLTLSAILRVLGEGVVPKALEGVDQALARLHANLAGRELTERIRKTLDRARALSAHSHQALDAGNLPGALAAALSSADQIRSLSPRYQAREAMERSTRALRAAHEAVEADPTGEETEALKKARRHLKRAREAFEAGRFRETIRHAYQAGELSRGVLEGRNPGP